MDALLGRIARLRQRLGLWRVIRGFVVAGVLVGISAFMASRGESILPFVGAMLGLALPCLALNILVDRIEMTQQLLRFWGPALVAGAFVAGALRGRVALSEQVLIGGAAVLFGLANGYVSTLFWVVSDQRLTYSENNNSAAR